jgi:hypothetical protein
LGRRTGTPDCAGSRCTGRASRPVERARRGGVVPRRRRPLGGWARRRCRCRASVALSDVVHGAGSALRDGIQCSGGPRSLSRPAVPVPPTESVVPRSLSRPAVPVPPTESVVPRSLSPSVVLDARWSPARDLPFRPERRCSRSRFPVSPSVDVDVAGGLTSAVGQRACPLDAFLPAFEACSGSS